MRSGWFEVFASSMKTSDESTQRDTNSSHEERKKRRELKKQENRPSKYRRGSGNEYVKTTREREERKESWTWHMTKE